MIIDWNPMPATHMLNLMQEACTRTGFTIGEIQALVDSDLETSYLLDYITAVMTRRMN